MKGEIVSCRKSLVGTSGSLGSKLDSSLIIPQGWGNGKSVAIRSDPRTAHICSLACSIVKVRLQSEATAKFCTRCKFLQRDHSLQR